MAAVILIPAYNPDDKLVEYVASLTGYGFDRILVVNDGSRAECKDFFDRLKQYPACTVITHEVNRGKGEALKTGMKYYLENCDGYAGIVTGDADGQHTLADTANLAAKLEEYPNSLLLGSRVFSEAEIPWRSAFGNGLTTKVFKLFYGVSLGDTQTGLRAIPNSLIPIFGQLEGSRFEYEMNMLIKCADSGIEIKEFPIETIYLDKNSSSHFNVVKDSVKIYWLILKRFIGYLISGIISFLVDQGAYRAAIYLLFPLISDRISGFGNAAQIFSATAGARVISSIVNFFINKLFVFSKKGETGQSFLKYVIVVIGIMLTSSTLVWLMNSLLPGISSANIKIVVDLLLVFVTYTLQRRWVFKKK